MTLPSKGTHTIRVGAADYHWRVSPGPPPCPCCSRRMQIIVQSATGRGQVLVVFTWHRPGDAWHGPPSARSITPALVRCVIEQAVPAGWTPGRGRGAVRFELTKDDRLAR